MPKILVVEDNALNRKMLERRLRHSGYEVVTATNGEQGVSLAIEQVPDLIVMDTDLPAMDGWQAIKLLKSSIITCGVPVIALTADAKSGNWKSALKVGCNDYDTKPIVLKRLLSKIDALLGVASSPPQTATAAQPVVAKELEAFKTKFAQPQSADAPDQTDAPEAEVSLDPNDEPAEERLNNRYQVIQVLSEGPFGRCLLAEDMAAATSVIVNAFNLPVETSKLLELTRQTLIAEMRFLAVISRQDNIATCLDHFEENGVFYWVQSHIVGTSLADELGSAQSMGYVLQLTHSLLSCIHSFHQGQIVHCECHPHSFIRRQSDGRIVMVDYGVLQRLFVNLRSHSLDYRKALLTQQRHYQPAEQRVGNLQLGSDIYSIGMILLQALTGQTPEWLVTVNGQRNLTGLVNADPNIVKIFERMVSPNQQSRFKSADEALASLPLGLIPKETVYQQAFSS